MKKITFDSLPEAVAELLERVGQIEKLLTKKAPVKESGPKKSAKTRKPHTKVRKGKDVLTIQEASKLLNISTFNLYSYVRNNKIPFKKEKGRLFFSKPELENWNKDRTTGKQNGSGEGITVKEAQKLLNVPAPSLYYYIKSRKIPVISKKGNKTYFSKQALLDAVSKGGKKNKS